MQDPAQKEKQEIPPDHLIPLSACPVTVCIHTVLTRIFHAQMNRSNFKSAWKRQNGRFRPDIFFHSIGKSFLKSYAGVCMEGAVIVLACTIFSVFAATPPTVNPDAAAASMVWSYIGELIFNMLVLVGSVKMADRIVREMGL